MLQFQFLVNEDKKLGHFVAFTPDLQPPRIAPCVFFGFTIAKYVTGVVILLALILFSVT